MEEKFAEQLRHWKRNLAGYYTPQQSSDMDALQGIIERAPVASLSDLLSSINSKITPVSAPAQADQRALIVDALKAANYKTGRDRKAVRAAPEKQVRAARKRAPVKKK